MNSDALLDRIPCGIVKLQLDDDFTILYANQAFLQLYEAPLSLREILCPDDYLRLFYKIHSHMSGSPERFELELKTYTRDGNERFNIMQFDCVPEENVLVGASFDITQRKQEMDNLRIQKEQYRIASSHSDRRHVIYDFDSGTLTHLPDGTKDFEAASAISMSSGFHIQNDCIHRESVQEYLDFLSSMEKGISEAKCILRMRNPGSAYHWLSFRYSLLCDESQSVKGVISYQDITDQYEKELAYQKWMQHMEEEKKDCIGYYEYNLKYNLLEEIIGGLSDKFPGCAEKSFTEIIRYTAEHFVYEDDRKEFLKVFNRNNLLKHYDHGERTLQLEHRRIRFDGSLFWALGLIQMVLDPYTGTIKAFILIKNIDAQKCETLMLQEMSRQDPLTGLLNRRFAVESIRAIFAGHSGHHILLMLDIDRFKQLNDLYGHQFGDKALHVAATRLKSSLRRDDIFGRMGGDEFIVLLKNVSYDIDVYARLESFCNLVGSALEPEVHISASFGAAAYPEDGTTFEELYEKADIALYHAKNHGRNQYAVYEPAMTRNFI